MQPDRPPLESMDDARLSQARWAGVPGANMEIMARDQRRRWLAGEPGHGGSPDLSAGDPFGLLWNSLLLALPLVLLYAIVTGLARGVSWLAERSVLAPLFPAPGDSPARYALSVVTLLVLVPGSLALLAVRLHPTRLRVVARLVLVPAAVLLVPIIIFVTQATTGVDLVRLPS
jgi:hypothetical protein